MLQTRGNFPSSMKILFIILWNIAKGPFGNSYLVKNARKDEMKMCLDCGNIASPFVSQAPHGDEISARPLVMPREMKS